MDPITLADYQEFDTDFWEKYFYVNEKLGSQSTPEQVIAVMESLAGVVVAKREEKEKEDYAPMGFNKTK
jgi:hypothetical protein